MIKIDFKTTFNMLSREAIVSAVLEHFPGLYKCVEFSYAEPSLLFFGAVLLMSELGVLHVHVRYMDNGSIIGDIPMVTR